MPSDQPFNLEEELQRIMGTNLPQINSQQETQDILNQKLLEASVELLQNDIARYGASSYQFCFLYLAIVVHRLKIDPAAAIDNLLGNLRNSLREAYGVQ